MTERYSQALKLSPDRFTPLSRTPWAGRRIFEKYKHAVVPDAAEAIGESWEVSCDPDFPSRVEALDMDLQTLIQKDPEPLLSRAYAQSKGHTCEILIKLLNAASPLSVQVHPTDTDPALKPNECGKPESWLVLDADAGAGLYLGFSRPLDKEHLRTLLSENADIREYLQFVPVHAGDYFEIQPGVPHAIGPGVTLLEPQRVLLGKSGKTYRFWDWGRRYSADGALDLEHGKARELHIEEGLKLIDPQTQVGTKFVDSLRRNAQTQALANGSIVARYPANPYYQVLRLSLPAGAELSLSMQDGFATLVSLEGEFQIKSVSGICSDFRLGEPGFLPYAAFPCSIKAKVATDVAFVIPQSSRFSAE